LSLELCECGLNIFCSLDPKWDWIDPELAGQLLDGIHFKHACVVGSISHHRQSSDVGNDFAKKFKTLICQIEILERNPSHIPSWPGQTLDHPGTERFVCKSNNRNGRGRLCHCPNTCSGRKDHVWIKLRKLMSILSVKFLSSFRPSKLQLYGLPVDPAETLQAVNKRACPRSPHRRSCSPKKCYDGRLS